MLERFQKLMLQVTQLSNQLIDLDIPFGLNDLCVNTNH